MIAIRHKIDAHETTTEYTDAYGLSIILHAAADRRFIWSGEPRCLPYLHIRQDHASIHLFTHDTEQWLLLLDQMLASPAIQAALAAREAKEGTA